MKITFPGLFLAALFLSSAIPAFALDPGWGTDYAKALARAKSDKRAVLVYFMSSQDGNCAKLRDEALNTLAFKHYAQKNFVLVEMDFGNHQAGQSAELKEQNDNLGQKLGIGGFPTLVVIDGTGKPLGQLGYVEGGPTALIEKLSEIYKPAAGGSGGGADEGAAVGKSGNGSGDDFDSFFKKPKGSPTP